MAHEQPPYLVVAVDPVNFEKPYTHHLEGVSTVHKSTPPDRYGKARLARGYPAITATIVNTRVPATTYANWFSYTLDFLRSPKTTKSDVPFVRAVSSLEKSNINCALWVIRGWMTRRYSGG